MTPDLARVEVRAAVFRPLFADWQDDIGAQPLEKSFALATGASDDADGDRQGRACAEGASPAIEYAGGRQRRRVGQLKIKSVD
jgi:hypothetical protein